jgi:hypothetical protein
MSVHQDLESGTDLVGGEARTPTILTANKVLFY